MAKTVIVFAGRNGSGKDTAAQYVASLRGAPHFRYSDILQETFKLWGYEENSRSELQALASFMQSLKDREALSKAMVRKCRTAPGLLMVVHGARMLKDLVLLKEAFGAGQVLAVWIETSADVRHERLEARKVKKGEEGMSREQFDQEDLAQTEQELDQVRAACAYEVGNDAPLDGQGHPERLYQQLEGLLELLEPFQTRHDDKVILAFSGEPKAGVTTASSFAYIALEADFCAPTDILHDVFLACGASGYGARDVYRLEACLRGIAKRDPLAQPLASRCRKSDKRVMVIDGLKSLSQLNSLISRFGAERVVSIWIEASLRQRYERMAAYAASLGKAFESRSQFELEHGSRQQELDRVRAACQHQVLNDQLLDADGEPVSMYRSLMELFSRLGLARRHARRSM